MKKICSLLFGVIFSTASICFAAVGMPIPVVPADGTATSTPKPEFIWTGVPEAITYYLQVSTDITFSNTIDTGTVTSLYISTSILAPTTYYDTVTPLEQNIFYWRVSADSGTTDSFSSWSSTSSVIVDITSPTAVLLNSPSDNYTTNQVSIQFTWFGSTETLSGIKNYILQLSTASNFSIININHSSITVNNSATLNLNQSSYTWRVNVEDNALNYTTSTVNYFLIVDTTPPGTPVPSSPANNISINTTTVTFIWSEITDSGPAGLKEYTLQLSTDVFNTTSKSSTTVLSTATISGIIQSTYSWRVIATDYANNKATSSVWNIEIDTTPPAVVADLSASTGTLGGEINLSWVAPGDDGTVGNISTGTFRIQYFTDSAFGVSSDIYISTSSVTPGTTRYYTLQNLVEGVTYYFKICTADEISNWSIFSSTVTTWAQSIVPSKVTNLTATPRWRGTVLTWWAPSDDAGYTNNLSSGAYEIKGTTYSFTSGDWDTISVTTSYYLLRSTSTTYGSTETIIVTNLTNSVTYYFALRTRDEIERHWSEISNSTSCVYTNSPPNAFSLSSPVGNTFVDTTLTPTFSWENKSDPDTVYGDTISSYTVIYSEDNFTTSISSGGLKISQFKPSSQLLENNTYWWYVLAFDRDGASIQSSTTGQFRLDVTNTESRPFDLVSPTGSIIVTTLTPLLTWQVTTDPDPWDTIDYEVQWSSTDFATWHFSTGIKVNYIILPSTPDSRVLIENATYWWKVRANSRREGSDRLYRPSNSTGTFRVNVSSENPYAPSLLWPENNQILTAQTTTFYWNPATDPDPWPENYVSSYTFELAKNIEFNLGRAGPFIISTTYYLYSFSSFDENTTWYWRVSAIDNTDRSSTSYSTSSVRLDFSNEPPCTFNLSSPTPCQIYPSSFPVFSWQANGDPDPWDRVKYVIKYSKTDRNLTVSFSSSDYIYVSSYSPTVALTENTTYWWQVIAYDYCSGRDEWATLKGSQTLTAIATFYINAYEQAPNTFNLLWPITNQILTQATTTFYWQNNGDPDPGDSVKEYRFYFDKNINFSDAGIKQSTIPLVEYPINISVYENTTCYWKVEAYDNRGDVAHGRTNLIRLSNTTGTVRVDTINDPPAPFNLVFPTGSVIITNTLTPLLTWYKTTDSDPWDTVEYEVWWSSSNFATYESSTGLKVNYLTIPRSLIENATYWWSVRAKGIREDGRESVRVSNSTETFRVNKDAQPPDGNFSSADPIFPAKGQILTVSATTFRWVEAVDPDPGGRVIRYDVWWTSWSYPIYGRIYESLSYASSGTISGDLNSIEISSLLDNTTYYWKVKAIDNTEPSALSTTSLVWVVRVDTVNAPPRSFDLISPGTNVPTAMSKIDTSIPTFYWQAKGDPDPWDKVKYKIEYSTTGTGFLVAVSSDIVYGSSYTPSIPLVENATYYWRVTAIDYNSDVQQWTDERGSSTLSTGILTFQVNASSEPPVEVSLVSPTNGWPFPVAKSSKKPTFDWEDAIDPDPGDKVDHYEFYLTSSASFADIYFSSPNVKNSNLTLPIELKENTTYWWKVLAVNGTDLETQSTTWYFFIPIVDTPKEPNGMKGELQTSQFVLSWSTVTENDDESPCDDLSGYNVYRATDISVVTTVPVSTFTILTTWTDTVSTTFYYLVRAVDSSGIESKDSVVVDSRETITWQDENKEVSVVIPKEISPILYKENNNYNSDLKMIIAKSSESGTVPALFYEFKMFKVVGDADITDEFNFPQAVEMKFSYAKVSSGAPRFTSNFSENDYSVFWYNNVEYVNLGGQVDNTAKSISVKSKEVGKYRVQGVIRATGFEITIRTPMKIFTPDGKGPDLTEKFRIYCANPKMSPVEGKIFDITGADLADMQVTQEYVNLQSVLVWDGMDRNSNLCRDGVYIYQIKSEGKTLSGTVILAK